MPPEATNGAGPNAIRGTDGIDRLGLRWRPSPQGVVGFAAADHTLPDSRELRRVSVEFLAKRATNVKTGKHVRKFHRPGMTTGDPRPAELGHRETFVGHPEVPWLNALSCCLLYTSDAADE